MLVRIRVVHAAHADADRVALQGSALRAEPPLIRAIGLLDRGELACRLLEALERHAHRCIGFKGIASAQQSRSGSKRNKDFAHLSLHRAGAFVPAPAADKASTSRSLAPCYRSAQPAQVP